MAITRTPPRVLLVEDHPDTRSMYQTFFQEQFQLTLASDGLQALDAIRAEPPDIVITDLTLPGMDGFELIARIRADAALAHVPIVCLSGLVAEEQIERATKAGAVRVLLKPCLPDALADVITEVLKTS